MVRRIDRINELLRQELSLLLEQDAEELGIVTVLGVATSPDLANATVWVAPLAEAPGNLLQKLEARLPEYRRRLGKKLDVKRIPRFTFTRDTHQAEYLKVETLLDQIRSNQ